MAYCSEIIEANSKAEEQEAAEPTVAPAPAPTFEDPGPVREPWHRDPAGSILVGIGSPVLVTGVILYGGSFGIANGEPPQQHTDHEQRQGRVRGMAATGLSLLGVGAALVIAGAIRWGLVARRGAPRRAGRRLRGFAWR